MRQILIFTSWQLIQGCICPQTEETCIKCSHGTLEFFTMQLRSADEGQTVFFECPKCKVCQCLMETCAFCRELQSVLRMSLLWTSAVFQIDTCCVGVCSTSGDRTTEACKIMALQRQRHRQRQCRQVGKCLLNQRGLVISCRIDAVTSRIVRIIETPRRTSSEFDIHRPMLVKAAGTQVCAHKAPGCKRPPKR